MVYFKQNNMNLLSCDHFHPIPMRNYLQESMHMVFDNWESFKKEFPLQFFDHNLIYRFDFYELTKLHKDEEGLWHKILLDGRLDEVEEYEQFLISERGFVEGINLQLSMIQQRKGNFLPIFISNIQKDELDDIEKYLKKHFDYILSIWKPFKP